MIIVLIFSQIQIVWSITYAITNIRDNFRAIDANIQEENVLRFQKYLEDSLNDLKLIAMEYKYSSDLYEYINNKDYASINNNFFADLQKQMVHIIQEQYRLIMVKHIYLMIIILHRK